MNLLRKMKEKNWNTKVTAAVVAVVLIAAACILVSIFHQYYTGIIEGQKKQLLIIAQSVSRELEQSVERSIQDLDFFVNSYDYLERKREYDRTGNEEAIKEGFSGYVQAHSPYIENMAYSDSAAGPDQPKTLYQVRSYRKLGIVSHIEGKEVALWKDGENGIAMSVHALDPEGGHVYALIDIGVMYDKMVSKIRLGEKGYVMVKNSDGIIIMHMLKEQLGIDVIEDRKILYPQLKIEETGLEAMINRQKKGLEGVEIYDSYWWFENNPQMAKKISAYTPADIGDGFLIVSAVIDLNELSQPLTVGMIKIVSLSLAVVIGFLGLILMSVSSIRRREQIEKENKTLNELNQTLNTLHANEQIMAHQQRLQIIGTMTGGIAHEFNNLLTPIMGYAGLMLETMDKEDENYEDVTEIYDAAEKAKEIIHQISTLSRRNMDTVYQFCDVGKLLERVAKMADSVKPAGVEIYLEIGNLTKGVFGNATQLNQVLLNLIVNSIHAIAEKTSFCQEDSCGQTCEIDAGEKNPEVESEKNHMGTIRIGYTELEKLPEEAWILGKDMDNTYGCITITDDGCGMNEATKAEIFEPFFTTKSANGGTGLGLSIVQSIVEAHKGYVKVESSPGKGTTFSIYLPVTAKKAERKTTGKIAGREAESAVTILLVDDNPKVLKVLEKGLTQAGFKVQAESNPLNVEKRIDSLNYDVIISDDAMKEMNGILLAEKIRRQDQTIPLVILTGLLRKEIIEAKQTGIITEYLIKPVSVSVLADHINILIKKS